MTIPTHTSIENAQDEISSEKDVVLSVKNVSKKFCKKLKRSMAYGIIDLSKNLVGIKPDSTQLRRDEFWALDDINFELRRGEALGVIGVNGSGKTTLLRLLAGIFPPDKGQIVIKGRVGTLIAVGAGFHPHMTGRENIRLNSAILGMSRMEIDSKFQDIVDFAGIGDFLDAPISTYSSGMRVRLGFAIAIHCEPDVLLVDEILAVGDIGFRAKCYGTIQRFRDNGCSVIVVSHNTTQLLKVVNQIMVLNRGKKLFQGDPCRAISIYEELVHRSKRRADKELEGLQIRINKCICRDHDGNEIYEFSTGDDIILEFHFKSTKKFKDINWLIAIHSVALGSIASFTNRSQEYHIDISKGKGVLWVTLSRVPLLVGAYEVVTHVYNGSEEIIGCGMNRFTFRITGPLVDPYRECRVIRLAQSWNSPS